MCRGRRLPAWQAATLQQLVAHQAVTLELLIRPPASVQGPGEGATSRVKRLARSENTLWDTFNNGYVARRAKSLQAVDCSDHMDGIPLLEATPLRKGKFSEYFTDDDLEQIRSYDLDFILRFAYGIIRGDILDAARHGVWSFHHGDEQRFRGSPPAFWEIATDSPVSGVLLQRLTDRLDGGIVLRKGWVRTTHHSYVKNTDAVHFAGVDFPAQVCRDILAGNDSYLDEAPSSTEAPVFLKPTDREVVRFAAQAGQAFVGRQISNLAWSDQWNIGLVRNPIADFLNPDFIPTVEWFQDTRGPGYYLADPFPRLAGGAGEVLVEDYDYTNRIGTISELNFDDMTITPVDVGTSSHASYPFAFDHNGVNYVVAQVAGQQGVELLTDSDGQLQPAGRIDIEGELLDPTLFEHDGLWWIFFTRPGTQSLTELHIWWADDLFGTWQPHRQNPVKSDIRSARPGGTPFEHEGALYRPAQDCSLCYGGAVSISRIDELTPNTFTETVVRTVKADPSWPYPHGVHTLSAAGDVTYLDAKRRVFNRHETLAELTARVRKLRPGRA